MKRIGRGPKAKRINLTLCTQEGKQAYRWMVDNKQNVSFLTEEYLKIISKQIKRIMIMKESGFIKDEIEFREFAIRLLAGLE